MSKICEYCGKEFISTNGNQKFCSYVCKEEKHKERMRMNYVGKREQRCVICGMDLPKFKTKYCSITFRRRADAIKAGVVEDHGLLLKTCVVCGKEFQTFKSRKITCSDECSKVRHNHRPYNPEKERKKYLKKHPNARRQEDIIRESQEKKRIKRENYEKWLAEKEIEWAENRAKKEAQKQANIAYWLEYEAEHECEICGEKFIAHYPTAKYCSDTCRRKADKERNGARKRRYKGITIDKDITLKKLATRDHNQCQICGLFVNWNDYIETDKAIICGDMYPSIDHIRPISLGGLHSWNNVQLAHRGCNTKKCNKYIG